MQRWSLQDRRPWKGDALTICILWLRRDLRLDDNPALVAAIRSHKRVIPLYIHEKGLSSSFGHDGLASRWWLHHSLVSLSEELSRKGSRLLIRSGEALEVIKNLIQETSAETVYWNRLYTPREIERDRSIKAWLEGQHIQVSSHNSALLKEPWVHRKPDGAPYRVFTPFWKSLEQSLSPDLPDACPQALPEVPDNLLGESPVSLGLLPKISWDEGFYSIWKPGEEGAWRNLDQFTNQAMSGYGHERDIPSLSSTSRLSPHLRFGEISIRRVFARIREVTEEGNVPGALTFAKELGWREFANHLLFHYPHTVEEPLDPRYTHFPWRTDFESDLVHWQRGMTGFPIIDAGMRELWATGWMHNRVRMIVASFLTKNLLIPWQRGAEWFWDTLVDADLAANTLGWQWSSGCGADAAPYFRIFNPILQGEKFDAEGRYVRQWVPEISRLPAIWIHRPFERSHAELDAFGVRLGEHYPLPIVDLANSRKRALDAYEVIRNRQTA